MQKATANLILGCEVVKWHDRQKAPGASFVQSMQATGCMYNHRTLLMSERQRNERVHGVPGAACVQAA
jgi:hypothetical protein